MQTVVTMFPKSQIWTDPSEYFHATREQNRQVVVLLSWDNPVPFFVG